MYVRLSCCSVSLSRAEFVNALSDVLFADSVGKDTKHSREEERFAHWRKEAKGFARLVIYPGIWWLDLWRAVNRIAGVYAFLDVPFRIAFQPFSSFGRKPLMCAMKGMRHHQCNHLPQPLPSPPLPSQQTRNLILLKYES